MKEIFSVFYDTIILWKPMHKEWEYDVLPKEVRRMKKFITFATAASLLMGSMVTPVYAAAFVDINTVTWDGFKPFLEQAADLGLMKGYDENGKKYCKPRNNVTYCEAVQLMYSIMKVYTGKDVSNTTVTKWQPVMSAYNIPDWAYKATAYALENSILSTSDLPNLQGNASKINTKAATREAVGVIFGKAMDTVNGYDIKSNAALTYADKGSVSSSAVPYLELLNRAGLMVGDTDNKFNPKANISRAEMAVLSVKTYNKLTEGGSDAPVSSTASVTAGTVVSSSLMQNGDLFITVKTNTGTTLSLFGTKGQVTPKYNGSAISFEDIGQGDTVKVTYTGTTLEALDVAYSVAGIDGAVSEDKDTTEETYELQEITSSKIYVLDGSKEKTFRLDDNVKVTLSGSKSTVSKLATALESASYDVTLKLDADEYVLEIAAVLNANNPTEGYVADVEKDEITIKVGTKEYTYPMLEDAEIEFDGKEVRFSKFEDEYDDYNYYVSLELNKDGKVEEIIIEYMEDECNGVLTYLTSSRIEIQAGGKTYHYNLTDDVDVTIDGKSGSVSKLKDAYRGDKEYRVSLELNRSDDVTEIVATMRSAADKEGELVDIDKNKVAVKTDGKKYTYDIANDVEVTINDKNRELNDLINNIGDYKFTVKLVFDKDDEVCEINAVLKEVNEGELKDMIPAKNFMTVVAAGLNVNLDLASDVDVTLDGDSITLDELNDEIDDISGSAYIFVELEYDKNSKVDEINAFWVDAEGELKVVYVDDDEIKVGTKTYVLARSTEITYRLSGSVDGSDYRDLDDYDDDLEGLEEFLDDCDDAKDKCMVSLTLSSGKVTGIRAVAK